MGLCAVKKAALYVWDHRHDVLAALGLIPVLGAIPDLLDALLYGLEGEYGSAVFALGAAVPLYGDLARLGKYGLKYGDDMLLFARKGLGNEIGAIGDVAGIASKGETSVIGRVKDLQNLKQGERSLLDRLQNQGSPKANWKQNSGVLRQEMAKGKPIRDASPGDTAGQFLNAERNLLKNRGWTFDPQTNYWMPPRQ